MALNCEQELVENYTNISYTDILKKIGGGSVVHFFYFRFLSMSINIQDIYFFFSNN